MSEQTTANRWYALLATEANTLSEELGLDDFGTQKLREFVFQKAKEQYRAGNRSGIRWARLNPSPGGFTAAPPQAEAPAMAAAPAGA